ncbi:aminopeptidase P family protein, partial [Schumannella luteola]
MADSTPVDTAAPAATPSATANRSTTPTSDAFREFIFGGWADRPDVAPSPRAQAAFAAARRLRLAAAFPTATLVIPAGPAKVRSNDTDYPYRAHSAFSHLTGWASDTVPGAVLVIGPGEDAPATLFFTPTAGRDSDEFYANAAIGEFWTGPRP